MPVRVGAPSSVYQPKTFYQTCVDFSNEKLKDLTKLFNYPFAWAARFSPNHPNVAVWNSLSGTMGDFKNALCAKDVIPEAVTSATAIKDFINDPSLPKARNAWKVGTKCVNTTYDGYSFVSRFVTLMCAESLKTFTKFHHGATFGGSVNGMAQTVQDYWALNNPNRAVTTWHGINFARDASFATLGGTGLASALGYLTIPSWWLLACATSGWAWSVGGFFWKEQVVDAMPPQAVTRSFRRQNV